MITARGLPEPYTFHKAYELIFDSGQLIEVIDCSQKMAKFRDMVKNGELKFSTSKKHCKAQEWLEQCFSFYYSR